MHPRTQELLQHLDAQRATLRDAVDAVPADLRDRKPAPERWSVAEILEHLALVESRLAQFFSSQVAEARGNGLGAESDTSSVLAKTRTGVVLDRRRRIMAAEFILPTGTLDTRAALAELERTRGVFREAILASDGLAIGEVTRPHPVLGPLDLYEWLAFTGYHEARHAAQIQELASELTSEVADRDGQ
ncbi:MAG: DinB family protein [Gemmatimonadaceae bacterium]